SRLRAYAGEDAGMASRRCQVSGHPLHIVGRTSFTLGPVSEAPLSLISGGVAGEEAAVKGAPFFGAAERTLDGRLLSPIIGIEGKGGVTAGAAKGKNGDSNGERNRRFRSPWKNAL